MHNEWAVSNLCIETKTLDALSFVFKFSLELYANNRLHLDVQYFSKNGLCHDGSKTQRLSILQR